MSKTFCRLLRDAIKDEREAPKHYQRLKKASRVGLKHKIFAKGNFVAQVSEIQKQERQHHRTLKKYEVFCR